MKFFSPYAYRTTQDFFFKQGPQPAEIGLKITKQFYESRHCVLKWMAYLRLTQKGLKTIVMKNYFL